jgi:hypothetical protein
MQKILRIARDGHHSPNLLLLVSQNQNLCTELPHIPSSHNSFSTSQVNQFLYPNQISHLSLLLVVRHTTLMLLLVLVDCSHTCLPRICLLCPTLIFIWLVYSMGYIMVEIWPRSRLLAFLLLTGHKNIGLIMLAYYM